MSQTKKKPTLQDVADAAGVSIATVSRAINNKESVKEGTYDKIVQAIYALGYDAVVRHESHLILILLPDIDNPFYSEVIRGISAAAGRQGYQEIIVRTGAHPLTLSFIEEMIEKTHADGVITLDPIPSAQTISQLELHTPLIQCAEYNEDSATSYVSIDDVAASRAVVDYILSKGKRKVAMINGPLKYKYARKRQQGFVEGLLAAGITPRAKPDRSSAGVQLRRGGLHRDPAAQHAGTPGCDLCRVRCVRRCRHKGRKTPRHLNSERARNHRL